MTEPTLQHILKVQTVNEDGSFVGIDLPTVFEQINAVPIGSETTIWTPASGKKFKLLGGLLSYTTASANVELIDGEGGDTVFVLPNAAVNTPFQFSIPGGITSVAADNPLRADGSTLQVLNGTIWGQEV